MKIAYTINGLVGGLTGKNEIRNDEKYVPMIASYCKKTIDSFFCTDNDIDFFIFTWHTNHIDDFKKIYNPKCLITEKQKQFQIHPSAENTQRSQSHVSRWYGYKKVIEEVISYVNTTNTIYDYVINARFDICWNKQINIQDKTKILLASYIGDERGTKQYFDKSQYFNIDNIPIKNPKSFSVIDLPDHIFGGDFKTMVNISKIYDNIWYLHNEKKYNRGIMMSHHRLLPGMIKEMNKKQNDIIYIDCLNEGGSHDGAYDVFRYRKLTIDKLR